MGITTLTNVDAISNIALDVRDMAESINQGEWVEARRIYEFEKNARQYDQYGNEMDEFLSLQRMAHEGKEWAFNDDPSYTFQMLGMANIGMGINETIATHGNLQSSAAEDNDNLKKDYASAVELSISRGKKIQLLEKNVETFETQLAEANQKMEKKSQTFVIEERLMQAAMASLRTKTQEAEETISALKHELSLQSAKTSRIEKLEINMAIAQEENYKSQSKISHLEEALHDISSATEDNDNLKKDYASAVELSISRGKKIQLLEKNVETFETQLAKANQKIEKRSQSFVSEEQLMQAAMTSLRTKTREDEETISALKQDLSLQSEKSSRNKKLEINLENAQKKNDESQSKITNLEEALRDMQVALKAATSRKDAAEKSSTDRPRGEEKAN